MSPDVFAERHRLMVASSHRLKHVPDGGTKVELAEFEHTLKSTIIATRQGPQADHGVDATR